MLAPSNSFCKMSGNSTIYLHLYVMAVFIPELCTWLYLKCPQQKQLGFDVSNPITYNANTGQTKAEKNFGIEACNTFFFVWYLEIYNYFVDIFGV